MHSARLELSILILIGTPTTYQATGDAVYLYRVVLCRDPPQEYDDKPEKACLLCPTLGDERISPTSD